MSQCVINGCPKDAHYSAGWCPMHYQRWKKHGDVYWVPTPKTPEDRFWAKVDRNGPTPPHAPELGACWLWTASKHRSGHGEFFVSPERGRVGAPRFSLEISGVLPASSEDYCCHKCDNPPCVNPSHLFWGSALENVRDAIAKGRHAHGETNGAALLKEEWIIPIRERYAGGETARSLGIEFGVSEATIGAIARGDRWSHVGGPTERRGVGRPRKDRCANGHEFTEDNTYWHFRADRQTWERSCRACRKTSAESRKATANG